MRRLSWMGASMAQSTRCVSRTRWVDMIPLARTMICLAATLRSLRAAIIAARQRYEGNDAQRTSALVQADQAERIFARKYCSSSAIGTRSCAIVSRSRTVTVPASAGSLPCPIVSKSTVTQNGVPISS